MQQQSSGSGCTEPCADLMQAGAHSCNHHVTQSRADLCWHLGFKYLVHIGL